jgi:hypothetical protein
MTALAAGAGAEMMLGTTDVAMAADLLKEILK